MQHHHQHEELLSLVALQRQQPLQAQQQHRQLASNSSSSNAKNTIDLMDLTDFDVQLALTENLGIQIFEVTDIVTRWMNDAFRICLVNQLGSSNSDSDTTVGGNVTTGGDAGNDVDAVMDQYADFDTIILLERNYNNGSNRRRLQDTEETATTTTTTTDQEEPPAETTSDAKDAETVPTTAGTSGFT